MLKINILVFRIFWIKNRKISNGNPVLHGGWSRRPRHTHSLIHSQRAWTDPMQWRENCENTVGTTTTRCPGIANVNFRNWGMRLLKYAYAVTFAHFITRDGAAIILILCFEKCVTDFLRRILIYLVLCRVFCHPWRSFCCLMTYHPICRSSEGQHHWLCISKWVCCGTEVHSWRDWRERYQFRTWTMRTSILPTKTAFPSVAYTNCMPMVR